MARYAISPSPQPPERTAVIHANCPWEHSLAYKQSKLICIKLVCSEEGRLWRGSMHCMPPKDTQHVSKPAAVAHSLNPMTLWLMPQAPEIFNIHQEDSASRLEALTAGSHWDTVPQTSRRDSASEPDCDHVLNHNSPLLRVFHLILNPCCRANKLRAESSVCNTLTCVTGRMS